MKTIKTLIRQKKYYEAHELICDRLSHRDKVDYAIHAAELTLPIWEKEYPRSKKPHQVLAAAKAWLDNPCEVTAKIAHETAYYADITAKSRNSIRAALNAAYAASSKEDWYISTTITHAIMYAVETGADWKKILEYGINLLTPNSIHFVMQK